MITAALLAAFHIAGPATCLPVETDRILARDLASVAPPFSSLPPDTPIAYAPAPGSRRVFRVAELRHLASRHGIQMAAEADLCFERLMEMLTADTLISAMRITPGFEQAQIDIVEFSRFAVPRGHLEFPREGLVGGSEPAAGALWRGFVRYGENRKFAIWARARISVSFRRVVAAANLSAGNPITPEQVRVEEYTALVPRQGQAQSVEQVAGRVPRRSVAAGSAICLYQLDEAKDIRRGDMVEIDVRSGTTRLSFVGRAETAGRVGENISIRNLSSGRTFRARVEGKGVAVVTTGASR